MKIRTLGIVSGLLTLLVGCSNIWEKLEPDRYRGGVTVRRVEGSFRNPIKFKVAENIPVLTIQGNRRINESWDSYLRFSFNKGSVEASPLDVRAQGHIESGELGLSYFPFRKDEVENKFDISLDFGGEIGYADFDMIGKVGPIYSNVHDSVLFWGGKVGATAEYKLNNKISLFASGWYNLTDNNADKCSANLDGGGCFFGLEIKLP